MGKASINKKVEGKERGDQPTQLRAALAGLFSTTAYHHRPAGLISRKEHQRRRKLSKKIYEKELERSPSSS